jgi:hypothetical protein
MTKDNLSQRMNEMKTILKHKDANITVKLLDNNLFMPYGTWETSYPVDLIEQILSLKGPASLCDEIMRDESIDYVFNTPQSLLWGFLEPPFEKGVWGIIMLTEWNWVRRHILSIKSGIIL